jgi:hypothetical protein
LADLPLLVVLTWRTESVRRSGALQGATTTAAREGVATVVDLERLDLDAVAELATAWLPAPLTTSAALRLWQETGGLPLFVTEYLAAFSRDGQAPDVGQWQLPGGMRDLLQSRLDGLGETTRQVLAAGAVLGRDLSPDLLRATSGRGEAEVVDALDEAVDRAVVVQTERGTHEFGHESMRQLIYDTSSLARRRLLHSRAADALAGRRVPPAAPDVVAAHLRLAGRADESAVWSWQAAERARGLYAHGEALEHLAQPPRTAIRARRCTRPPVTCSLPSGATARPSTPMSGPPRPPLRTTPWPLPPSSIGWRRCTTGSVRGMSLPATSRPH